MTSSAQIYTLTLPFAVKFSIFSIFANQEELVFEKKTFNDVLVHVSQLSWSEQIGGFFVGRMENGKFKCIAVFLNVFLDNRHGQLAVFIA